MKLHQILESYLRARVTLISVVSREEERIVAEVEKLSTEKKPRFILSWDIADGFKTIAGYGKLPPKCQSPLNTLQEIEKIDTECVVLLKDFHECLRNQPMISRKLRNLSQEFKYTKKTIILSGVTNKLPDDLIDACVTLTLPLPGCDELNEILDDLLRVPGVKVSLTPKEREHLISASLGLTHNQAGDMKKFWEAIQAFYSGRPHYARALLQKIQHLPDAQFILAIAWLNEKEYTNASVIIENIISQRYPIGKQLEQLRIPLTVRMDIEAGWGMELPGSRTGVIIAGARSRQQLQRETEALDLLFSDPNIQEMLEVQLLMADIYISASDDSPSGNRNALEEAIRIACSVENKNELLSSVCRYYNAKAMRRLGCFDQAERTLLELLNSDQLDDSYVKYELARMYEDAGNTRQAQRRYQEIYASFPDFLDVRERMIL